MILLQSSLVDVLKPEKGVFPYYESFLSRYTLITITAIVSQCGLLPESYEGMTKADIDRDIDEIIKSLPAASEERRNEYRFYCRSAHIDTGRLVQENENRVFASALFTQDASKYSLSNREMILRGLNSSAFLNYFFLVEDSLGKIYIDLVNHQDKFIKGSKIFKECLRKIISEVDISKEFEKELYARSKIFFDIKSLEIMWDLLNLIRNKIAHTNGFYDHKAKLSLKRRIESLAQYYIANDGCLLSIHMIVDKFKKHEAEVEKTGYLVIDDSLENIIRNISIFTMESLYACYRDKNANKA